jgi:hypothetical protein
MTHALADDHEWKPGPVTEWANEWRMGSEGSVVTGQEAWAMVVVCECGEWRRLPLKERTRGEVPGR